MRTNKGLVSYVVAQIGKPYWFGTFGNKATSALYFAKKKQYPTEYVEIDYKSQYGERVHDCIGLIKGAAWSDTPTSKPMYKASQDIGADRMRELSDAKPISTLPELPGALVFASGHVGVYIGEGYVVEAYNHARGVIKSRLSDRNFTHWGKCPWFEYPEISKPATDVKSVQTIAGEVIKGLWGNGDDRKRRLTAAGYDYDAIQTAVNALLAKKNKKDLNAIAVQVIRGDWGNGKARIRRLKSAGFTDAEIVEIQDRVNKML